MNIKQLHEKYIVPICKSVNAIIDAQKGFLTEGIYSVADAAAYSPYNPNKYVIQDNFTEDEIASLLDKYDNADNDKNKYENIINVFNYMREYNRIFNISRKTIESIIILGLINDNDGILRRNYITNAKYILLTISSDDINNYQNIIDPYCEYYYKLIMNAGIDNDYNDLINSLPNDSRNYKNEYFIITNGYLNDEHSKKDKTIKKMSSASLFKKWLYPVYKDDYTQYITEYGLMNLASLAVAASALNLKDKGLTKRKILNETFKAYNAYNNADKNQVFRKACNILIDMKTSNTYNKFDSETILTALNYTDEFAKETASVDTVDYWGQVKDEFSKAIVKCNNDNNNVINNSIHILMDKAGINNDSNQVPVQRLKLFVQMLKNVNNIDDDIIDAYSKINDDYYGFYPHLNIIMPLSLCRVICNYSLTEQMTYFKNVFKNNDTALRFHIMNALNQYIVKAIPNNFIGVADKTNGFKNLLTDIVSKGEINNYYKVKTQYEKTTDIEGRHDYNYAIVKLPEFIRAIVNILLTDETYVKRLHDTHGLSAYDDFNALYNDPRIMSISDYDASKCYKIDCNENAFNIRNELVDDVLPVITAADCINK